MAEQSAGGWVKDVGGLVAGGDGLQVRHLGQQLQKHNKQSQASLCIVTTNICVVQHAATKAQWT